MQRSLQERLSTLAAYVGLGTVLALGLVVRALLAERRRQNELQHDLEATQTALDQAAAHAQQAEPDRQRTIAETERLATGLRGRLGVAAGQSVG